MKHKTTEEFLHGIERTFSECLTLAKAKNQDYAGLDDPFRNFKSSLHVGVPLERAILVRLMDKITRISNLLDKESAVDEKKADTIKDAINYLAILLEALE